MGYAAFVGIGNGVREDGSASAIGEAIVNRMFDPTGTSLWAFNKPVAVFSGGYRSPRGTTEAGSMFDEATAIPDVYVALQRLTLIKEEASCGTHNNAIEGMKLVSRKLADGGTVFICDHPLHIARTMLCFKTVNRLFYPEQKFNLVALPCEEVYDASVYGQSYWASVRLFRSREKKMLFFYRILLFNLWARVGLRLLQTARPNMNPAKP